jgi:Trypsin-like peptidase domain
MEDSSLNPFIPGSSDALQRKVVRPQTAFARMSKRALIVGGVLVLLIGIGLFFVFQHVSVVDDKARADLASALQPPDQLSKLITVQSKFGFTVSYQDQLFTSHGEIGLSRISARGVGDQVTSQSYENNDLKKIRSYGLVRITPIESSERSRAAVALPPELEINAYDKNLLLQTDEQKAAEADKSATKGDLAVSTFVTVDTKKRLGDRTSDDGTIVTIEATKPVRQEIAGIEYQMVRFTTHNENYQISTEKYDDCYYTIQNNEPYSVCVTNVRPNSISQASLLEDTIRFVSYQEPEQAATPDKKAATTADASSDATATEKDADQIKLTPPYLKDPLVLEAIAKNQPNVMRLGTLYCANIDLKQADGSTVTSLTDACAGKVSSGVFISKTGHIATAGHAVRFAPEEALSGYINLAGSQDEMLDRLQRVLDYLLKSRLILQSSADYLKTGAATGNQDALAKIENIGSIIPNDYVQVSNENYSYAVQLADKPIVLNTATGNKPSFAYSDSVVKANYVNSNYDASKYSQATFDTDHSANDIALLKTDGTFPVATIGAGDGLGNNQKLATVGFPAFVDSSLTADKILNIPIATEGAVNQTFQLGDRKIIDANTPVYPGSDGAPVFNEASQLVGFATYGPSFCPNQQCFGSGTIRSSNDLSLLLDKHNITLENKSSSSDNWAAGVDAYFTGNYQVAASKFASAGQQYSFNQWADKLVQLTKSKFGSSSDTSLMNQLAGIGIGTEVFLVIAMIVLGVLLFIHIKRLDNLQVGHYGAGQAAPASIVTQPGPMQPQPYQQPQQYGMPQQQPVGSSWPPQQPPVSTPYSQSQAPAQTRWAQPQASIGQPPVGQPTMPPQQPGQITQPPQQNPPQGNDQFFGQ